jgi:hypothetical protein
MNKFLWCLVAAIFVFVLVGFSQYNSRLNIIEASLHSAQQPKERDSTKWIRSPKVIINTEGNSVIVSGE